MFFDQKRQIQILNSKLEQAMKERKSYEEKSCHLQQVEDFPYSPLIASSLSSMSCREASWSSEAKSETV